MKKNNLINSKGISVIFLIIAMLLMVTIGYVLSYLIPSKQKSVVFPIQSTQAFFIAQSGAEFAVRYAISQTPPWITPTQLDGLDNMTRSLGAGRFVLDYDSTNDSLISKGEVPTGAERRRVRVSNFISFLTQGVILDPDSPVPCRTIIFDMSQWPWRFVHVIRFYIKSPSGITLDSFQSTWTGSPGSPRIRYILMDGNTRYGPGNYNSGDNQTAFSSTQTINPGQTIMVEIQFNRMFTSGPNNMHVLFYAGSQASDLDLDPEGDGFPPC